MKKILSILLFLPALGLAMDAPLAQSKSDLQKAKQLLAQELEDTFIFTIGKEEAI